MRENIVPIQMNLEPFVSSLMPLQQLLLDIRIAGDGGKGRKPVVVGDHVVDDGAGLEHTRPAKAPSEAPVGAWGRSVKEEMLITFT